MGVRDDGLMIGVIDCAWARLLCVVDVCHQSIVENVRTAAIVPRRCRGIERSLLSPTIELAISSQSSSRRPTSEKLF